MLLCNQIGSRIQFFREQIGGKRVLELGSGIGFPGLLAAKMCSPKEMLFTDLNSHIDLLRQNVEAVELMKHINLSDSAGLEPGRVSQTKLLVEPYDWNQTETSFGKFDVILGSDLVYNPALYPLLIRAILLHSSPHTVTYLGVTKSDTNRNFFKQLQANDLEFYRIPDWEMEGKSNAGSTRNFGIFVIFMKR
jgi:predicted nicotinamide N-methyase